jgi:predicted permease
MTDTLTISLKIAPLYLIVLLGFIGGKLLKIDRSSIISVLFYLVTPIVFFDTGVNTKLHVGYLLLPIIFFLLASLLCLLYLHYAKKIWHDQRSSILAFAAGSSNTGYFGLPIALMFFDIQTVGIYMLASTGMSIFDYTVGAYVMARGHYTKKQALYKLLKLPMLYAFTLGIMLNAYSIVMPYGLNNLLMHIRGTFIILGTMMIGLSLSTLKHFKLDFKFISAILSAKFIVYPLIVGCLIYIDRTIFHLYSSNIHAVILLLSFMPAAVNTVIFAALHGSYVEEAATAVLICTILAMFLVPAVVSLFGVIG